MTTKKENLSFYPLIQFLNSELFELILAKIITKNMFNEIIDDYYDKKIKEVLKR